VKIAERTRRGQSRYQDKQAAEQKETIKGRGMIQSENKNAPPQTSKESLTQEKPRTGKKKSGI